jgi:TctA family transporter
MIGAQGDWTVFLTRPAALALILLSAATLAGGLWRRSG